MGPNPEFFSVSAQVIPVLVLTGVLEGRIFARTDKQDGHLMWLWLIGLLAAAAVGEASALTAILLGTPTWKHAAVVMVAWGFAGGILLYGMIWNLFSRIPDKAPPLATLVVSFVGILVPLVVPGAAFAYALNLWVR